MTGPIEISSQLEQWAKRADYTLTPGSRTGDGRAVFWASLGEIRLLIGRNRDGWLVVTDSDRMGPEHFVLAAPSSTTIEKYFFGRFALSLRSSHGLSRMRVPNSAERMSNHYNIDTRLFEGVERFALIASDGSTVAIGSADRVTARAELTKLARYLTATVDQIEASAVDPDGKPLFEPL
ncbi:TNT antitoxin family protein [Mycobacterium sp. 852002-51057_SCH5723018]|uniref:TNT antitoxin family protein n=1 Tax=Mycobacterium sp. 852002-51057_SCH5723018 TaxID=1834094 RepID=UPI0009EF4E05|nr:TNT antitoxin family protein [Mycobacterium sp. 852002-51057_SCH5723018]